jgi:signal peptidase II
LKELPEEMKKKSSGSSMKLKKQDYIFFSMVFGVILFDQLTKFLIRKFFLVNQSLFIIDPFFYFTYLQNTGAGFGLFKGASFILIWIAVIVMGLLLYFYDRIPKIPGALILGGTIGNLIDRIFLGFVTDFIDFRIWPAFNIADSCMTIGVILMLIFLLRQSEQKKK